MPVLPFNRFLATGLLLLACALASPSDARQNNYVRCLQKQLVQLGENPGPIDGAWGGRTKRAAIALRDKTPALKGNPYLTEANRQTALSWCRELAIQYPDVSRFQPSHEPINFTFDKELKLVEISPDYWNVKFTGYTDSIRETLRLNYGIERTSQIDVVVGEDPKQIARNLNQLTHKQRIDFVGLTRSIREDCTEGVLKGAVLHQWMYICARGGLLWPASNPATEARMDRHLEHVLMHEYVHVFQSEYSLYMSRRNLNQSFEQIAGPNWLVEGIAEVIATDYSQRHRTSYPAVIVLALYAATRTDQRELKSLKFEKNASRDYPVAHLAVHLLAMRYGSNSVLDYWRLIGQGTPKDQAFETLFGMTVTEYETLFKELRQSTSPLLAFAKGESLPDRALPPQPRLSISN